jgi:hypothetical protein
VVHNRDNAPAASDSLAVFEKPLLAALSGDDVGGISAADVRHRAFDIAVIVQVTHCGAGFQRPLHGARQLL